MSRARIGGKLYLPYQDGAGNDIPIASGEVIYKMPALTVDGSIIRVPTTVIAEIRNGVLEPKDLAFGVWHADIRPFTPAGYAKRIKFLADREQMDLSEVIPMPIEGLEYVRGEAGTHITSITTDETAGLIVIALSDGVVYSFPLPHAALSEADHATLDEALETVTTGTTTIQDLATTLQSAIANTTSALDSNLQALADGVDAVAQDAAAVALGVTQVEQARDQATTEAANALQYSEIAYTHSRAAEIAKNGAENALQSLQTGIANGDFKGEDGVTPNVDDFVTSTNISGLWAGTQAQYDALTPDPGVVYIIKEN